MKKKSDKLVVAVFKQYIVFVLILGLICLGSYVFLGFRLTEVLNKNSIPLMDIVSGDYIDYTKLNVNDLEKIDAEVEIVNKDGEVVKRIGKEISTKNSYTPKELLDLVSTKNEAKYQTIINNVSDNSNNEYLAIFRIPNDKLELNVNLLKVPFSVGKPLYKEYGIVIAFAAMMALICIIIYSAWTARRIQKPLKEIDNALLSVINGDFEQRLRFDGEEELEGVRDTLNYLLVKLKESEDENKRLEESKTKLLLDLSHDIKTPMTTIKGYSAALSQHVITDEETKEKYYNILYKKSERVSELIDDFFEFVKLSNKENKINKEKTDITEFLRRIVLDYYDEIESAGLDLEVDVPDGPIFIGIDKRLFKRVIGNLIENSLKYNGSAKYIKLKAREDNGYFYITVSDDGVGIPNHIRLNLFDEFVRGDESRKSGEGSGLGLSIVKKVVERHGGKVQLLNTKKGCSIMIKLNK